MKKSLLFIVLLFLFSAPDVLAQSRTLKQVIELQMPKKTGDELCGTRGGSVCWNPETKMYYAAFCGNKGFPLALYTQAGKRVSKDDLTAMEDIRGIWYNPAAKKIMANTYDDIGWISYKLDKAGTPTDIDYKYSGMNQPNGQSVGSYDSRLKRVFFLDYSRVMLYEDFADMFARADDSVQIHWGRKKSEGIGNYENEFDENPDYNRTTVISTGIKNAEFGFLNTDKKQIELYDLKEGFLQQTLKLPYDAPVETMFNFAFTNGIYWLFDIERRKWVGYK